eukprot:366257-Chlamydomonas_euryale.AAC.4
MKISGRLDKPRSALSLVTLVIRRLKSPADREVDGGGVQLLRHMPATPRSPCLSPPAKHAGKPVPKASQPY